MRAAGGGRSASGTPSARRSTNLRPSPSPSPYRELDDAPPVGDQPPDQVGRLAVSITIVVAVTGIMEFSVLFFVPAASKNKDLGFCTVTFGTVNE
jgi:hypothetical protein